MQEAGLQGAGMGGVMGREGKGREGKGRENAVNNRMETFNIKDHFSVGSEKQVYRTLVLQAQEEVNMKDSNTKQ
jgi:hypothetical protein